MLKRESAKLGARIVCGILVLVIFFVIPMPHNRPAFTQSLGGVQSEIPYGGMRIFTLICTCSANTLLYIMDYATNQLLALIYQPGVSMLYSYYDIYGTYFLGSYRGGGQCRIYAGKGCVTIPSRGTLGNMPGTGTSL